MTDTRPAWYPTGARDKHVDNDTELISDPRLAEMIARRELPDTWETDGPDGIDLDRSWLPWFDGIREGADTVVANTVPMRLSTAAQALADAIREHGSIRIVVLSPDDPAYPTNRKATP